MNCSVLVNRGEIQRGRVDAIAPAGGLGTIFENMAQVRLTAAAQHLGAHHEMAAVGFHFNGVLSERLPIAGPAGAGVIFAVGAKQFSPAGRAAIDPGGLVSGVFTGEGSLGALLSQDVILFRRQLRPPFGVGFDDFFWGHGFLLLRIAISIADAGRGRSRGTYYGGFAQTSLNRYQPV